MKASLFAVLILHVYAALAGISSSPGFQREDQGGSCTFQWTVTGPITQFIVYNQTTGNPKPLNSRGSSKFDSASKTVRLTLSSIELWDAGNYTLSISNGAAWENDSNALLFVFGSGSTSLNQTSGRNPATEGDSVELTCAFTSSSQPLAFRPRVWYVWYPWRFGPYFQALSNGSLEMSNGDIVSSYSSRDDGRTLIIASMQREDVQYIACSAWEERSYNSYLSPSVYLDCQYKPLVLSTNPPSRKFNADVGERVSLSMDIDANPRPLDKKGNWTFVSSQGTALDLPDSSVVFFFVGPSLSFNLASASYYGNYSCDLTNAIGTTTVTFQVLPPGPPDPPTAFQVVYVTHFSIVLQWTSMSSNFDSQSQYIPTQLREAKSNLTVQEHGFAIYGSAYNTTQTITFSSAVQPDTQYEASVWSTNSLGSSGVTTLSVRSAKVSRFVVSPDSIEIRETTAFIRYRVESGNITHFAIFCCYELTGWCTSSESEVNNTLNLTAINIRSLPNGAEYVFDFVLYAGRTVVGSVKGIRVSTAITASANSDLTPAVIALAVLLAIAVTAVAAMLLGFCVWKRLHNFRTAEVQQTNFTMMS